MEIKKKIEVIVGAQYVLSEPEPLASYSKDYSFCPPRKPTYVVQPMEAREIQEIVKLANEYKIPVIPSSSGVHFYGGTIPNQGGIVVDLRRMNQILEIDERNRMVRVEPGLGWGPLQRELEKHSMRALNPLLPHPLKSVLTSSIEREPPVIPKYEYADPVLTLEVILPNGQLFRTGSASSPGVPDNTLVDLVGPYGPGTDFARLFQGAQGTFGIVTWVSLKIEHFSTLQKLFFVSFQAIEDAVEFTYRVQRLMIGQENLLLNNFNLASILADKEFTLEPLRGVLPPFTFIIRIAGGPRRPEERMEYEEEALRTVCQELSLELQESLPEIPEVEKSLLDMLRQPWMKKETYWKFRHKGCCCSIFFHTTLTKVPEFMQIVHNFVSKHEYPVENVGYYLQPLEYGRACYCEYDFPYNPDDQKEVEKIKTLHRGVSEVLLENGAYFATPYGILSDLMYSRCGAYSTVLRQVKDILDPNNVMNPGKVCFN